MVDKVNVEEALFKDKENILDDLSKVYDESLYSDITFTLTDDVSISTNRFMLACRIPYFATMLFGEFAEKSSSTVPLECCDSEVFKKILDFVWKGEISFTNMKIMTVLDLLETARFFCIDLLVDGIVDNLRHLFETNQVEHKECLTALDFIIQHKFTTVTRSILNCIDKNLTAVSSLPEFTNLSECSYDCTAGITLLGWVRDNLGSN